MDILKVLVIIAFVFVTICTIKIHPSIHQPMLIEDADFKLTRISDTLTPESVTTTISTTSEAPKNRQLEQQPRETQQQVVEFKDNLTTSNEVGQSQTKYIQSQNVEPQRARIKNITPKQSRQQQIVNNPQVDDMDDFEMVQQILKNVQEETKTFPVPKSSQTVQTSSPKSRTNNYRNPYMTEQEEIIAWNRWRSNIQNQIMKDSDIEYAPLGTLFLFTFVADKYGNISNIKVECSNPNYMNVARNNVKPAIARLQKKPILNFPRGTQRSSTVVTGAFLIGTQERFSSPNDYSDYERVKY